MAGETAMILEMIVPVIIFTFGLILGGALVLAGVKYDLDN
jgi:hypothetical protein